MLVAQAFDTMLAGWMTVRRNYLITCPYNGLQCTFIEGNVANYVETEMLVEADIFGPIVRESICPRPTACFVIVRGSPPVFFEQKPDPKQYKPKLNLRRRTLPSLAPFRQHFVALVRQFEKVSIVNLVEEKGSEVTLILQKIQTDNNLR